MVAVPIRVQIEEGGKRVFASAVDWPGWSRSGRTAAEGLAALVDYADRYRAAIAASRTRFPARVRPGDLAVVETTVGTSSTDFGVPAVPASSDEGTLSAAERRRFVAVLQACWGTFDETATRLAKAQLRTGPRGGGRDVAKMRAHVTEGEFGYLTSLGGKAPPGADIAAIRVAFLAAVDGRLADDIADRGPRGGRRWPARYAIRRSAWHALDHAWEMEDRAGR